MRELIDRQAAINAISYSEIAYYPGDYDSEVLRRDSVVKAAILSIVPIDAEPEIVRCKECKWSYDDVSGRICSHGVCVDCVVSDDFYCAEAERSEEDDE